MEITKQQAQKLFNESPEWFKKQLKEAFGKECFEKKHFRDIKTFEDACEALGISSDGGCMPVYDEEESADEIAYKKLKVIVAAINQGWTPDWRDSSQTKWFPWFRVLSSGSGFSVSHYDYVNASTCVGSRLCFETKEKAEFAATQFIDLYKSFLL
jgi:hypothetical protein